MAAAKKREETSPVLEEMKAAEPEPVHGSGVKPAYDVKEFAAMSGEVFGTSPDIVTAAFFCAGITRATKEEAVSLVSEFLSR